MSARLTDDDRSALEELDHGSTREQIPFHEAERLLTFGLAELSVGRLDLTPAGRHVLAVLRAA